MNGTGPCSDILDLAQCELDTRSECNRKGFPEDSESRGIDADYVKLEQFRPVIENALKLREYLNLTVTLLCEAVSCNNCGSKDCPACTFIKEVEQVLKDSCPVSPQLAERIAIFTGPEEE